ncbi:hypothetical protein [Pigmentibacter ruber]|uniref:hypothetical protein n=1 Tax=Pigmentibacter ruber TaxID=2683196 RepID=UPI00131C70A5|nr:hypothetical protein [Pigmentibacter ruber]
MTINVISWAYSQESISDILLQKTNCGHAAFEILMNSKSYKELIKKNQIFSDVYKKTSYVDSKLSDILAKYSKYKKVILKMIDNWNASLVSKLPKDIVSDCYKLYELNVFIKRYNMILPKRIYHGKEKYISFYFSFWPGSYIQEATLETTQQKNIVMKYQSKDELRVIRSNANNSIQEDMDDEADGVDIAKLFSDLKINNLELISTIPRDPNSDNSWDKKEKMVYKVKSGALKGTLVTSATYLEYQSLKDYFLGKRKFSHRFLFLNQDGDVNDALIPKVSTDELKVINKLESCIQSIINDLRFLNHSQDRTNARKLRELKNILLDEKNSLTKILDSNKLTQGLPPSHIISLPSKGLEGFGLDEERIIEIWLKDIVPCGYSYNSTNCSWAVMRALSQETEHFKSTPLKRYFTPITPREVVDYFSEVQDCMFKKYSQQITNLNRNSLIPEKKLWTLDEFKKNTPGTGVLGLFKEANRYSSSNIKEIEDLIVSYQRIANHEIKWRLKYLNQMADRLSIWFEDKFDQIVNKKSTRYNGMKNLLNQIAIEREKLVEYLLYTF